jgi:tRNA (guanine-N(7)-)-methyltransferase subunit TRM82
MTKIIRSMPKKPCALVNSPDDKSIYSADKFGDVYSLPLIPTVEDHETFQARSKKAAEPKSFTPSATETTVHTKANLRSLESQLKQAQKGKALTKPKEPLDFPHALLLGHVSLLTDLLVTTIKPNESAENPRTYLITSDRDEHIRISRGPPQAYVIEGFCLGHHEFINKLCLAEPGLLVSGGGDDELLVWDWLSQKLINRVNILKAVQRMKHNFIREKVVEEDIEMDGSDIRHVPDEQKIEEEIEAMENMTKADEKLIEAEERSAHPSAGLPAKTKIGKIAVTNIWRFISPSMGKVKSLSSPSDKSNTNTAPQSHLLISIEGLPALFHFPISSLRTEHGGEDIGYLPLPGNCLDIVQLRNTNTLVVSVDTIHEAGSTTVVDSSEVCSSLVTIALPY